MQSIFCRTAITLLYPYLVWDSVEESFWMPISVHYGHPCPAQQAVKNLRIHCIRPSAPGCCCTRVMVYILRPHHFPGYMSCSLSLPSADSYQTPALARGQSRGVARHRLGCRLQALYWRHIICLFSPHAASAQHFTYLGNILPLGKEGFSHFRQVYTKGALTLRPRSICVFSFEIQFATTSDNLPMYATWYTSGCFENFGRTHYQF